MHCREFIHDEDASYGEIVVFATNEVWTETASFRWGRESELPTRAEAATAADRYVQEEVTRNLLTRVDDESILNP